MNSLISKVINEAVAGYESGTAMVRVSVRPNPPGGPAIIEATPPDIVAAGSRGIPPLPSPKRAPKPRFEVDLDWNTDSNLYAGFSEEPVGVFVATHHLLDVGSVVDLEVTLPDGRVFTTTGRVRWVQEPRDPNDETQSGLGIEFTHVAARPSWGAAMTPSMPAIDVLSIHPLRATDAEALADFGKARPPKFFDD